MERRLSPSENLKDGGKFSSLPADYIKMVNDVFTTNFEEGLQAFCKIRPNSHFFSQGQVYSNEVVLSVSLLSPGQLAATTVHASCNFDPKASAPTIQDLLAICVDAIGGAFLMLLDPTKPDLLQQLAEEPLSALENISYFWTETEVNKKSVFIKIDKSNPEMDQLADDWLKKHDPEFEAREEKEAKETEKLFFTGPKRPGDSGETEH